MIYVSLLLSSVLPFDQHGGHFFKDVLLHGPGVLPDEAVRDAQGQLFQLLFDGQDAPDVQVAHRVTLSVKGLLVLVLVKITSAGTG